MLEGLACQTREPDEIIVADDGSMTDTAEMVKGFAGELPFPVFHVWQEDLGFRAARIRNRAIKESSGEYIIFLDGDCIPNRHYLADHVKLAEKGCFVQGKRIIVGRGASPSFNASHSNSLAALLRMALAGRISNRHHILRLPFLPALKNMRFKGIKSCNMGIFREDAIAVNGFNEAFIGWGREDSEFASRLFKFGLRRKEHLFMAVCFHLWHPENPKAHLGVNEATLRATMDGDEYRCREGIFSS